MTYSHNQLLVLWHLKRYGPIERGNSKQSILRVTADELGMKQSTLRYLLQKLEEDDVVLRSYKGPKATGFQGGGNNPLIRIELVDPNMELPAIPQVYAAEPEKVRKPTPLGVVLAHETEELEERIVHAEPTVESIVEALVDRALELQHQVDKLQDIIEGLNQDNARLRKASAAPKPIHLSNRVREVLPDETWEALRRQGVKP